MKAAFFHLTFSIIFLSLLNFNHPEKPTKESTPAKEQPNVILMIGDGMGLSQLSSVYYAQEKEPNFSRFPITGLVKTSSSSHKITDSAAGATAYSCGEKSYNGAIAVATDSTTALQTLPELLAMENYRSGLISTSSITHATPACFYAHSDSRNKEEFIAEQLVNSQINFFAGGGKQFFFHREDGSSLYKNLSTNYILDTTALTEHTWQAEERYGYLLSGRGMPRMVDDRGDFLPRSTGYALDYLSNNEQPFFLMVEGSQIDWGGHANDGEYLVTEAVDFDKAVGRALDFAEREGNTIVIVTADHECGGFTLASTRKKVPFQGMQRDYDDLSYKFSTGGHSATMVPVLAYGPGQEKFTGIMENTEIHGKLLEILGLEGS